MPPAIMLIEALPAIIMGTAPLDLAAGSALGAGALGAMGAGSVGALLTGTAIGSTLLQVGLTIGVSYIAQLLAGGNNNQQTASVSQQSMQVTSNESTAPRIRVYGRAKISGARMFWANLAGGSFGGRTVAIYHCDGPIDAIEEIWFGDEKASFPESHFAGNWDVVTPIAAPMSGKATVQSFRGTSAQTYSTWLAGSTAAWVSTDRARGCCYTIANYASVASADYLNTYKSNEPLLRVVVRGARVWDPRNGAQNATEDWYAPTTWAWSDNAALVILDYLRHPDGRAKPLAEIDVDSFRAFADICDEAVPLKHGDTEKRYRIWGTYGLTDEPSAVQKKLLAACDGELYLTPAGKIAIRGGVAAAPTVSYAQDAVLSWSMARGVGKMVASNTTTLTYLSPQHDYQMVEADPWVDAESVALVGPLDTSLSLECVPSNGQARRLAKIAAGKANPPWKGQVTLDVTGLDALPERAVALQIDELGIDETFFVARIPSVAQDLTAVTLEVASLPASIYAWNPAVEEGEAPPIVPSADVDTAVPVPTIASAVVESAAVGGTPVGSVTVTVATPSDASLGVLFRWQKSGSGIWTQATSAAGTWSINTGALVDDASYDFQAMSYSTSSKHSDWCTAVTRTILADPTAPGVPLDPTAVISGSSVVIVVTAPNASNVRTLAIWRGTSTFAGAARIVDLYVAANQVVTTEDAPGHGTWKYWVTAENASGIASSPVATSPASVTL